MTANDNTDIESKDESHSHCIKCDGPCSIHLFRRYASYTSTETTDSELSEDEELKLIQARTDYVTHHLNEGEPVECNDPKCPYKEQPSLSRIISPSLSTMIESHYIFCHKLSKKTSSMPTLCRQNSNRFLSLSPSNSDKSLAPTQLLKKTKSVRYQKLLVEQVRQRKSSQSDVLVFGVQFICSKTEAKWKNPKEEVLKNTFIKTPIISKEWNTLLRSCKKYSKTRNAMKLQLTIKDVIGLKLYTDFDELQREFRVCFRSQNIKRQSEFFYWNELLVQACRKSKDYISGKLYHGVSKLTRTSTFNGTYYGPVSTTTHYETAKQFSGDDGRILELESTYGRPGFQLSWLSNYPDESEVLYMNITLSITNIFHPKSDQSAMESSRKDIQAIAKKYKDNFKEKLDDKTLNEWKDIQKNAASALKKMSRATNIISLNHGIDENTCDFSKLESKEKVGILTLIYLQYHIDENKSLQRFLEWHRPMAEIMSNIRDQFIEMANNIEGVRMFYLTPLIEHYLVTDQKYYKWPINISGKTCKNDCLAFAASYKEKQPIQLQTVIRLFPTAKELIINAHNWDWTLNSFVKFCQKWHFDYSVVPLKYIKIKFVRQPGKAFIDKLVEYIQDKKDSDVTPEMIDKIDSKHEQSNCSEDTKNDSDTRDDEQAAKRLKENKEAKENLSKLLRLGWRFVTPSKLQRIDSFEPAPELPFLLRFMAKVSGKNNEKIYFRSYTRKILHQESIPEDSDDEDIWDEFKENKEEEGKLWEGSLSKVEIEHNPKNCILTSKVFQKISYGNQLVSVLKKIKSDELKVSPGGNYHDNEMIKACENVKVLVLQYKNDPLEQKFQKVFMNTSGKQNIELECNNCSTSKGKQVQFMETENELDNNVKDICYGSIFKIFKNVTDIFLRQTEFDEKECDKLIKFLQENKQCKFERIFYKLKDVNDVDAMDEFKEDEEYEYDIDDDDDDDLRDKLKEINWDLVENGQIVINKKQFNEWTL